MSMQNIVRPAVCSLLLTLLMQAPLASADQPLQRQPSASPADLVLADEDFDAYLQQTRSRIRQALAPRFQQESEPFTGGYTLDEVVDMRAPYELQPAENCQPLPEAPRTGFLLIHGLTDSPYLLRPLAESLAARYPCALLRAVVLPGHATVPGDTLTMRHQSWQELTSNAIDAFRPHVEQLFLVGFSTGSTLSLDYALRHPEEEFIAGLVMLSPALRAGTSAAALLPLVAVFRDWLSVDGDRDAAKYESFSINAGRQFYDLSKALPLAGQTPLHLPLFMAISGDDATIDAGAARDFFCRRGPPGQRLMIWYQSQASGSAPPALCSGMMSVEAADPASRVLTYAHTSITLPAGDPHYGLQGRYRNCLHYGDGSPERERCRDPGNREVVFAERNVLDEEALDGRLFARSSFNPRYLQMMSSLYCFIEGSCAAMQALPQSLP